MASTEANFIQHNDSYQHGRFGGVWLGSLAKFDLAVWQDLIWRFGGKWVGELVNLRGENYSILAKIPQPPT
ncbi:DUF1925 domain-containing protein [Candidatus Saccharibacteria bacterium]|nr:DUF1925 domain-containing protein [Candidatus Saccharibacteria bacterium]